MPNETLTITDNRTGKTYTLPIDKDAIRAIDLRQIKTGPDDFGLLSYDPAFLNTASCQSAITYLDGDRGILRYRGYPIEQLAEKCSFLEVAYLLLNGELPGPDELDEWIADVTRHTMIHENLKKFMEGFHYDAHPMGMLMSTVAALSTFYPEARNIHDPAARKLQITRLIGKMPTLTAYSYRHSLGLPYVYPDNDLGYTKNFMNMLWRRTEPKFSANPVLARALEVLFILHADHEQNCSTSTMRAVGSSFADPLRHHGRGHRRALRTAARRRQRRSAAHARRDRLQGPRAGLHRADQGRARQADGLRPPRLQELRSARPHHQTGCRGSLRGHRPQSQAGYRPGIGAHRARTTISSSSASCIPTWISTRASSTRPWDSRRTCSRCCSPFRATVGWLAQWQEMLQDGEQKIARPRQLYIGKQARQVVRIEERQAPTEVLAAVAC
jgi:citrate synthase